MILTDLRARHWRGLPEVTLTEFSPGLNLVLGPNESGKSRIVEALWFALFESSKGRAEHKRALQSWGGAEGPRVEVGFRAGGRDYRVTKQFLSAPATLLEGGGQTWKGDEAEGRLAELLGTAPAGRRAEAGDLGVWPLLWVRQFESSLPPHAALNEGTRGRLHDLLAEEVGQIAVGPDGLALLERARAEATRYWTATGRATGELRAAQEVAAVAESALVEARARKEELHGSAAELARVEQALEALGERLRARRAALEAARGKAVEAARVGQDLKAQEAQVQLARQREEAARAELTLRREREAALGERDREITTARTRVADLGEREARVAEQLVEAEEALRGAAERHRRAKEILRRAVAQERRHEAAARLKELRERIAEVRAVSEELVALGRTAGALRVDRAVVERLRAARGEWEKAEARLAGAAARLEINVLRELSVAGEVLAAGETRTWTCTEPTSVDLGGVARVSVAPGGAELPKLRERTASLRGGWEDFLAEAGVATLAEAEEQWERRQEAERQAVQAAGFLKARCPEGLPVLEAQAAKAQQLFEGLGPEDPESPDSLEARAEADRAAEAEEAARTERDARAAALAALRVDVGVAAQRTRGLEEERGRLARLAEQMPTLAALEEAAASAERGWQEALGTREALRRRYEALGGDGAADDLSREEASCAALEGQRRELERTREQLVGRLEVLRGEALHEREQEADEAWTRAKRNLDATTRWAEAARTLADALLAARREAQERLTAPVRARVEPYLRQVFPGSALGLSEEWEVKGLATGNVEEPFAELSGGAREQLGLIVRVGLGELLAAEDRLPLVLDDALPNTDFERVERLHRVLYQAAKKLQILVFSCHPEAFDGLGADRTYRLPARARG